MDPLVIAALNTAPATGSARLMAATLRETVFKGGAACVPAYPRDGLSASFIDPAVAALHQGGAQVQTGRRVAALTMARAAWRRWPRRTGRWPWPRRTRW